MTRTSTKSHFHIIPHHIYPFDVLLSVNQEDWELHDLLETTANNSPEDFAEHLMNLPKTVLARTAMLPSNLTVIRLFTKNVSPENLAGTIAHEVFHASTFILDRIGVSFTQGVSDEAYAYLIGFLAEQIHKHLRNGK